MSRTLSVRPLLPSLPLALADGVRKRARRPPAHPASHTSTWRSVARRVGGDDANLVAAWLLACEARRRRGIVARERAALGGRPASPLLHRRVRALEKELSTIVRSVERYGVNLVVRRAVPRSAPPVVAPPARSIPVAALLNQ